jgi:hypothetical protein
VTDVDRQALAGKQIDHRQRAEASTVGELLRKTGGRGRD